MTRQGKVGLALVALAFALIMAPVVSKAQPPSASGAQPSSASGAQPASAQPQPAPEISSPAASSTEISAQLSQLNTTLLAIQQLLERHLETRSLELLMKRGESQSREVEQLEGRMRGLVEQRSSLEEQRRQLELRSDSLQLQIDRGTMEADADQLEAFREQVQQELQRLSGELRRIGGEISELEGRLTSKRRDLQEWQDFIDRRLGSL